MTVISVARRPIADSGNGISASQRKSLPSMRVLDAHVSVVKNGELIAGRLVHIKKRVYAISGGRVVVAFNHEEECQPTVLVDGRPTQNYNLRLRGNNKRFGGL